VWHKTLPIALALYAGLAWSEVDINQADMATLDGIRGIGPSMSRKILLERGQGRFKSWVDLMARVPGIKDKFAAKLSADGLTVNGQSFVETSKSSQ
jgi:competence protein ComEA